MFGQMFSRRWPSIVRLSALTFGIIGLVIVINFIVQQNANKICDFGKPCVYQPPVDIRIIVLTYNRPASLLKCLNATKSLLFGGDRAAMEIWIDRNDKGLIDEKTLEISEDFSWSQGSAAVHVQRNHTGLHGQWINTWRPAEGSKELSLYLEDDVDISPYGYLWLKEAWKKYGDDPSLGGIVLQNEYIITAAGRLTGVTFPRPEEDPLFMYPILMPWGFAPNLKYWRQFQDWYHNQSTYQFLPFVPEAGLYNSWFEDMVKANKTGSMWTMWFNYFCHKHNLYLIYANLPTYSGRKNTRLVCHRRERGLHFRGNKLESCYNNLLSHWNNSYIKWPVHVKKYNYDGSYSTNK